MMRVVVITSLAALLTFSACGDSGGNGSDAGDSADGDVTDVSEPDADGTGGDVDPDVPDGQGDTTGDDGTDGGDGPPDGGDEVTVPVDPAIDFWFHDGADATKGQGESEVTLYPEDEPSAYQAIPGFQTNIVVQLAGVATGDILTLTVDGAVFGSQAIVASEQTATITFSNQSLAESAAGYDVTLSVGDEPALSVSKTVSVETTPCTLTVTPDEDTCVTEDADPATEGFDVAVNIAAAEGDACDALVLSWQLGADGDVNEITDAQLTDGAVDLMIEVAGAGAKVADDLIITASAVHPASAALDSEAVARALVVDNDAPIISLTAPDGDLLDQLDLSHDQDGDTPGIQFDVLGAAEGIEDESEVLLWLDGEQVATTTVAGGLFAFEDVTFEGTGDVEIAVSGTDACGNDATGGATIAVFSVEPTLTITKPLDGAVLLAKGDANLATPLTYETTVEVAPTGLLEDDTVRIECQGSGAAGYLLVGSGTWTEAGGLEAIDVAIDVAVQGSVVSCRAAVDGPNATTSLDVGLTVALPAPTLTLSAPADGASLNTKLVTFQGEAGGLEGQPVSFALSQGGNLACELTEGAVAEGAYSIAIDLDVACGGLADGTYTVAVDAMDAWGNVVSELQPTPTASITFDTLPPSVQRTVPAALQLDPVANPGDADESGAPGYQTTFTYVASGEVDLTGTQICFTLRGQLVSCKDVDAVTGAATWTGVTLLPNNNDIEAQAIDAFGNGSEVLAEVINLVLDVPVVDFVTPAADLVVSQSSIEVVINVSDQDSGIGIDAASVTLLIDGADSGVAAVNGGDGTYTFSNVPLTEDTQVGLQAVASFAGQEGASGIRLVTWKTSQPSVVVTSPADGSVFNLASPECLGSGQNCTTGVTASVSNAEPGSAVTVSVACGDDVTLLEGTYSGADLVFDAVVLSHGATCTLTPSVTDAADQTVEGDAVSVTVDRVAPVVESFVAPAGDQLINFDDVLGGQGGMQHPLQVRVSGVEAGQVVSVTMDWVDNETLEPSSVVFQHTVEVTSGDGVKYTAGFSAPAGSGVVTYGTASDGFEGDVTLTATVLDAASNSASGNTVVFVKPVAPSVRITAPSYVAGQACTAGTCQTGLCNQGSCWTAWGKLSARQMLVSLTGLLTSEANLRICSDHASLAAAGTPCASEGYFEVALVDAPADDSHFVVFDESDLPEGFQTLIAESLPEEGGAWLSSLDEPAAGERLRQLYVDVTAPQVDAITSPSDTQPPFGVLNNAEQVSPGGVYDVRVEASEDGTAEVFLQGAKVAEVDVESGVAVFSVDLDEGANELYVRVMDFAGNLSAASTAPQLVTLDVDVDTVLPSLLFVSPSSSPLVAGDPLNVVLNSNKNGSQVTLFDSGASIGTLEVTDGQVTFDDATYGVLGEGSHTLTATVVDPSGNENSAATTPATVDVDTLAPTGTIVAPTQGEALSDGDDASDAPGYQIDVDFSTADGAQDWTLWMAYGCDDTYANCGAPTQVASGSVTNPGAAEPTETVDVAVNATPAYVSVILETRDAVGNSATTAVGVTFSLSCVIGLTDLIDGSWYNGTFCDGGAPCATANITLTGEFVGPCGGVDELRLVDGGTVLGTDLDVDDNVGVFDITLTDGATMAFELKGFAGGTEVASSGAAIRKVDLTPPDVTFVAESVAGFITPAADSDELYNASDDASGVLAGFQGHASVEIDDANVNGGKVLSLTGTTDGITVDLVPSNVSLPANINANGPHSQTLQDLAYSDQATTTVTVTASDAAGNTSTSSFDVTVDTVAPGAVALDAIQASDVNARLPSVTLNWTAVGDNGAGGSVAADVYDIRFSRSAITSEAEFDGACPVAGANGLLNSPELPAPGAPGSDETYTVMGPDPRDESALVAGQPCKLAASLPEDGASGQQYHFAVRVADVAGNWSPVSASVSTTDLVYQRTRVRWTDNFVTATALVPAFFKDIISVDLAATGDMDGDGTGDFVVGHFVPDVLCWFRGGQLGTDYDVDDLTGAAHTCIKGAASAVPGGIQIGSYIDALGDVNGDTHMDFGASGKIAATGKGFVAVFLGSPFAGPDLSAPDVLILGADGITGPPYFNWCGAGDFTGDGLGDIAVGEPSLDQLHVIPGSSSWTFGQGGEGGQVVFDVDVAGDLVAASAITIKADFGTAATFGEKCRAAGDLLPTPGGGAAAGELLILQSSNDDARLFVVAGRGETPGANDQVTVTLNPAVDPSAGDLESVRLRQDLLEGAAISGWANAFDATEDLTGDGVPDVMVTHGNRSTHNGDGKAIWIFDGAAVAGAVGGDLRVSVQGGLNGKSWTGVNGTVLQADISNFFRGVRVVGNFDGWTLDGASTPDIWSADNTKTAIEVRANHEDEGGASVLGEFPYTDAFLANPDPALAGSGNSIGLNIDGGVDLTGDSLPDIILGTQKGEVLLIH